MGFEINDTAAARQALAQNRSSQSELGSWSIDLTFCVRMLEIYGLKADSDAVKQAISHSIQMAKGFLEERIAMVIKELKIEEGHLIKLSEDALLAKDREMVYKHQDLVKQVDLARADFGSLRSTLYDLIGELKSI